jgi:hypothetical protein
MDHIKSNLMISVSTHIQLIFTNCNMSIPATFFCRNQNASRDIPGQSPIVCIFFHFMNEISGAEDGRVRPSGSPNPRDCRL